MAAKLLSIMATGALLLVPLSMTQDPANRTMQPPLIGLSVPSQVVAIAPEQSGKIVSIPVADGDTVVKDQVLFRLSSRLQQLEVERLQALAESNLIQLRAQTSLKFAEQQERRVRQLRVQKISSESDLQEQTYEVEIAKLRVDQAVLEQAQALNELEQAKERLAQRTLQSPIDGIVTQRFESEGATVEKFLPVLEVISLHPLWIEFDCPVAEEVLFRSGAEISVSPAMRPQDTRTAKIVYTSMKATPSSHTFLVRAAVANEDHSWKSGLKMLIRRPDRKSERASATPGK